jgi:hypothetical protein
MDVVYAVETAQIPTEECGVVLVHKGEHWPADDPAVKASPSLFSTDPRYGLQYSAEPPGYNDPPVEQATAAPGERRSVRRG